MKQGVKLGFIQGNKRIAKFRIVPGQQLLIGKKQSNDIVLDDSHISGHHAQLLMDSSGALYILDADSTNGTFINGRPLVSNSPERISEADKIVLTKSKNIQLVFNPDDFKTGKPSGGKGGAKEVFQNTDLISLLERKTVVRIGRTAECDLRIDHPTISRLHATIEKRSNGKYVITDKGSLNGTFVNGHRVKGKAQVNQHDIIFIGRFKIRFRGVVEDISKSLTISAVNIEKKYGKNIGLHKCSFQIPSSSLLAVMGPSGCGKSTLLKSLCGDSPASSGKVELFGLNLLTHFDYLKSQIGYVPQDDIVHRQLTIRQSMEYAAKLRMPNTSQQNRIKKIEKVLVQLNIDKKIWNNLVANISGGQRKRVSIAVELLTDPMVLFLDEPTSPLDPQTIEEFLGILRALAKNGTSVIMVTHKPDDLEFMDSVMFMTNGGYLVYNGSVSKCLQHFGVSKIRDIYKELDDRASLWVKKSNVSQNIDKNIITQPPAKGIASSNFFHQYYWLSRRYLDIKFNDKMNTGIMVGQAPIIAMLVCIIFINITQAVPFLMAISAIWFGANNAAREIVSEIPIYKRERMFNQGILPYILSKLTVLGGFAALQSLLFVAIVTLFYSNVSSPDVQWFNPFNSFCWMLFISIAASLMGLLISSMSDTSEKVMTLVPIALIPQIMLAGLVAKISNGFVEFLSYFTLSRWGTEGFCIIQEKVMVDKMEVKEGTGVFDEDNPQEFIQPEMVKSDQDTVANAVSNINEQFHKSYENFGDLQSTLTLDFIAIGILSLVFFIGIYIALKLKDPLKIK